MTAPVDRGAQAVILELDEHLPRVAATARVKGLVDALVRRVDGGARIFGALSSPCDSASVYQRGFDEAMQVLQCLRLLAVSEDAPRTMSADDLGPVRLLLGSSNRHAVSGAADCPGLFAGRGTAADVACRAQGIEPAAVVAVRKLVEALALP